MGHSSSAAELGPPIRPPSERPVVPPQIPWFVAAIRVRRMNGIVHGLVTDSARMKTRHSERGLPRTFCALPGAEKAVLVGDVRVTRCSRLSMKLLVFERKRDLHRFWKDGLGSGGLSGDCIGAVFDPSIEVVRVAKDGTESDHRRLVDPTYFAIMGLIRTRLELEVVVHESVHAAFAYMRRAGGRMWPNSDNPEEWVAYPAGKIASGVMALLGSS